MKRTANLVGGPNDGAEIHHLDPALGKEGFPKYIDMMTGQIGIIRADGNHQGMMTRYILAAVHAEYDGDETWQTATYVHESFRGYVPK